VRPALLITAKDLRQRLRDRSVLLVGVVAPLGLAFILSSVLGGIDEDPASFPLGVVDEDGGQIADALLTTLDDIADAGVITVDRFDDRRTATAAVEAGEPSAVIVVPAGFGDEVTAGEAATLEVLGSNDAQIGTQVAAAIADGFAARLTTTQVAVGTVVAGSGGLDAEATAELARRAAELEPAITTGEITTERRQLDLTTYMSASMAVFFLFFTVQFGVISLLEERRDGTLPRLLAAPISRVAVYAGKGLTSFALGVLSMAVLAVGSRLLMGADWGDPFGVTILVLAAVTSSVAIVAVVATLSRTAEQANVWQSIIAVTLGLLGGAFFDITRSASWLAVIANLTPHRWFLRGLEDLAGGGTAVDVLPSIAALLAFSAVAATVAGVVLVRRGPA
jgi:ABC-2 type transport system permease protein